MNILDRDTSVILTSKEQATLRDELLVAAAQAGKTEAFAELQTHYSRQVYRTIFAITKNHEDAEDALQDTFLRAYLALRNFEGRSSFYSWLTRIAMNSALMILRKRRARPEVSFEPIYEDGEGNAHFEFKDSAMNPEQIYDQRQRYNNMVSVVQNLEPSLRNSIQIRMEHGCPLKEIARTLDLTVAAVKTRLHRARVRLSAKRAFGKLEENRHNSSRSQRRGVPGFRVENRHV